MMMEDMITRKGPVGAWVKRADLVFSNVVRKTSGNGTFNRSDWQLLNFLHEKSKTTEPEILEFLSFFEQEQAIRKVINRFLNDGLITGNQGGVAITPKGEQVFEEVSKIQDEIKEKALQGISESAYTTTIETLQRITDNLREYLPDVAKP